MGTSSTVGHPISGPEPCAVRAGTSSTVGHPISGPGPNQRHPKTTRARQSVDKQSGTYSFQLRSTSPTSAGAQLGSAVRQHDYDGVPVQSTYFHNSKLPATLTSFYVAGETILEVPHPMFPQMFVHLVVASFSCTTLEENMTTPTETDWAQVYTLMLKRLAKDLHASHNRLKNALELNRIQEFQQRYIPNVRYFQTVGYVPENRLTTASESFSIFLQQTLSQQTTMTTPLRQLCVHLSCAICSHIAVAEQFQEVSLISHNGKLLGIKLHMNVPPIEHADIEFKSCYAFAHNCAQLTAAEILREGVIRPSATQYPDRLYTSGFYCRAEIYRDHSSAAYITAQTEAFRKASKYSHYKDHFRPFCIYGKARSRQSHHLTISVGGTVSDHGGLQFFDCIHSHRDKRWSFRSHLCQIFGIAAFL